MKPDAALRKQNYPGTVTRYNQLSENKFSSIDDREGGFKLISEVFPDFGIDGLSYSISKVVTLESS